MATAIEVQFDGQQEGPRIDPREEEDWFECLDAEAQDVVRQRWLDEQLEWERVGFAHGAAWRQDLIRGGLLVGGVHTCVVVMVSILTGGTSLLNLALHVLVATLVGVALGAFGRVVRAELLLCAVSGCVVLALFELAMGTHLVLAVGAGFFGGMTGQYLGLLRAEIPGS